jgi:Domain of unknown function (DUF5666)
MNSSRNTIAFFLVAVGLAISACGIGSGGTGAPSAANTEPSVVVGPITGFGSVIVNGTRFDDSSVTVLSSDGISLKREDLRLGMVVEIQGSFDTVNMNSKAQTIRVFTASSGPVTGVNAATNTLTALGGTIKINANTSFDGISDLSAIAPGDILEVYGLKDATTGEINATRIERRPVTSTPNNAVKITGKISIVDTANKRFSIGNTQVDYSTAILEPSNVVWQVGVEVVVNGTLLTPGAIVKAQKIETERPYAFQAGDLAELEGIVSNVSSIANFMVSGVTINAASAQFKSGSPALIRAGVRLEIKGKIVGNVLVATTVEIEGATSNATAVAGTPTTPSAVSNPVNTSPTGTVVIPPSGPGTIVPSETSTTAAIAGGTTAKIELEGKITAFTSASDFILRSTRVDATGASFQGGTVNTLAVGKKIKVIGRIAGDKVMATRVEIED